LLRLQAALQGADDPQAQNAPSSDLAEELRGAIRILNTLQAVNLPGVDRDAIQLQIPMAVGGHATQADVRIAGDGSPGQRLDPANVSLSLALKLTELGDLRIDIRVVDGVATCRMVAESDEKASFLAASAEELQKGLETSGYAVSSVTCHAGEPRGPRESTATPLMGLDFRV